MLLLISCVILGKPNLSGLPFQICKIMVFKVSSNVKHSILTLDALNPRIRCPIRIQFLNY